MEERDAWALDLQRVLSDGVEGVFYAPSLKCAPANVRTRPSAGQVSLGFAWTRHVHHVSLHACQMSPGCLVLGQCAAQRLPFPSFRAP